MVVTGDSFEIQYYVLENFVFWKSKEKTLLTLNLMLIIFFAMIPMWFFPMRYFVAAGLWISVAYNSPFWRAVGLAMFQMAIEYGIIMERWIPVYMNGFVDRIDNYYWPWFKYIVSWIPYFNRYLEQPKDKQSKQKEDK